MNNYKLDFIMALILTLILSLSLRDDEDSTEATYECPQNKDNIVHQIIHPDGRIECIFE